MAKQLTSAGTATAFPLRLRLHYKAARAASVKCLEGSMSEIAKTPEPPYYAVIFSSHRTEGDNGYGEMADRMVELAASQPGFLGMESVREDLGITVSYWESLESITNWKNNAEHREAQRLGHQKWYSSFRVRVARVEREYGI